jgi:hypothetical protein
MPSADLKLWVRLKRTKASGYYLSPFFKKSRGPRAFFSSGSKQLPSPMVGPVNNCQLSKKGPIGAGSGGAKPAEGQWRESDLVGRVSFFWEKLRLILEDENPGPGSCGPDSLNRGPVNSSSGEKLGESQRREKSRDFCFRAAAKFNQALGFRSSPNGPFRNPETGVGL